MTTRINGETAYDESEEDRDPETTETTKNADDHLPVPLVSGCRWLIRVVAAVDRSVFRHRSSSSAYAEQIFVPKLGEYGFG
jgi:hypothetical protein